MCNFWLFVFLDVYVEVMIRGIDKRGNAHPCLDFPFKQTLHVVLALPARAAFGGNNVSLLPSGNTRCICSPSDSRLSSLPRIRHRCDWLRSMAVSIHLYPSAACTNFSTGSTTPCTDHSTAYDSIHSYSNRYYPENDNICILYPYLCTRNSTCCCKWRRWAR